MGTKRIEFEGRVLIVPVEMVEGKSEGRFDLLDELDITLKCNPVDALLDEIRVLASDVIMGELGPQDFQRLDQFARKFEELDKAMSVGVMFPTDWTKERRKGQ